MNQNLRPVWMSAPATVIRRLRPDRNPLRRATDRAEAIVVAGLLAAFLVGSPVAAITAGHWASVAGQRAEQMARYTVRATLLQDAPGPFYSPYGSVVIPALARWTAPNGASRVGPVDADSSAAAGTAVTIWTTASGRPIGPPPPRSQVTTHAALAAIGAVIIVGVVLLVSGLVCIAVVNKRRLAAWEAAWQQVGPRWTSKT